MSQPTAGIQLVDRKPSNDGDRDGALNSDQVRYNVTGSVAQGGLICTKAAIPLLAEDDQPEKEPEVLREQVYRYPFPPTWVLVLSVFMAWAIMAVIANPRRGLPWLIFFSVLVAWFLFSHFAAKRNYNPIAWLESVGSLCTSYYKLAWIFVGILCLAVFGYWLITVARLEPWRLKPVGGLLFFLSATWMSSVHPTKVTWHPVLTGVLAQILLGAFVMRTEVGIAIFDVISRRAEDFFGNVKAGVVFVWGEKYADHIFVAQCMSTIIYFSSVNGILMYLGWFQYVFTILSKMVSCFMNTSPTESFSSSANVILSQLEIPLLVRPFLPRLTMSELHTMMSTGFATVSGSVLAAFMTMGISAKHIIAASVMSCPASLAISKLSWPETEEVVITMDEVAAVLNDPEVVTDKGIIEAAVNGATTAIPLVCGVCANMIAFAGLWSFLDSSFGWCASQVGYPGYDLTTTLGFVCWPLAFLMGVPNEDCLQVAQLLIKKVCLNEFIAYESLSAMKKSQAISERAIIISTYALNGFANVASIGIQLATLSLLCPDRKADVSKVVVRAMLTGCTTCFMTACIAGIML